ncbi:MAG: Outer membrane protein assembly factor BamB [Candidatus Methanophagaceae archaeon]|nr:MAG: Outer membrane protein assembly factor BamB [Methanophagales archaeon]
MIKVVARSGLVRAEDQSDIFYVINVASDTEWGSFHANAGYALSDAPAGPDIADYSDDIAAEGSASLIVARGKVFVYCTGWKGMYSDYTYLVALNQSNLKEVLWATQISPMVYGSWATPAYKDRSIFVTSGGSTSGGGYAYRIDADTGEIEWEFRFPGGYGSVNGGPAVTSRAVYVGDWNGKNYYSIDVATGNKTYWVFEVNGHSQSVPAIGYGNAYFGDAYNGSRAYCVDAWSGKEKWNRSVADGKNVCGTVTIADNIAYFTTYDFNGPGIFYALDAYNGSIVWESVTERTDSTPAYKPPSKSVRAYVYVAGGYSTKEVCCLDAKNGSIVWRVPGLGSWTNSPIVTKDGKVLVGKVAGGEALLMIPGYVGLYCLDALTGEEKWHTECGGSSPVLVGGIAYTIGNDGRVYAIGKDGAPDLTVLYATTAEDTSYVVGKQGVIKAMIQNIGKSDVTDDFYVELREKGVPLCNETVSGLNASEKKEVVLEWTPLTPGEHKLMVEVDPSPGVIPESNSLNNSWGPLPVEVKDNRPDLVASIIVPGTIYVGEVTIEANISNIGYETNKSFWVRFCVDAVKTSGRYMTLDNDTQSNITNFNWIASGIGNYTLSVEANPRNTDKVTINESDWSNNIAFQEVVVTQPTPTPTPSPGFGPGSGGGGGGGSAGGFGTGSGTGESGSGETGGMQMPVNVSTSAAEEEQKHEVSGYPFGNMSSGASGGGGTIPLLLVVVAIFIMTVFYFGYYREKKSHAKHISQGNEIKEGRRTNNKK